MKSAATTESPLSYAARIRQLRAMAKEAEGQTWRVEAVLRYDASLIQILGDALEAIYDVTVNEPDAVTAATRAAELAKEALDADPR